MWAENVGCHEIDAREPLGWIELAGNRLPCPDQTAQNGEIVNFKFHNVLHIGERMFFVNSHLSRATYYPCRTCQVKVLMTLP
jgi:hypothetical protein